MFTESTALGSLAATAATPGLDQGRLIAAAVIGIAILVLLITWAKIHPFIALVVSGLIIGIGAGYGPLATVNSFADSFGKTMASVGILVGLGAMFGKLLADSGGADRIVQTLVAHSSPRSLPWTMALVGALIGLPMFFEVGLVLLIPVILLVARRSGLPLMRVAIPTLAGLSAMHGLVPPHPGPLAALANFPNGNLGITLMLGVLVAIPTVIISGPLFSLLAAKWVPVGVPASMDALIGSASHDAAGSAPTVPDSSPEAGSGTAAVRGAVAMAEPPDHSNPNGAGSGAAETESPSKTTRKGPSFPAAVICVLLPVALMLANAIHEIAAPDADDGDKTVSWLGNLLAFVGAPTVALAIGLVVSMVVLGRGGGMPWTKVNASTAAGLPAIAGIILIVGAGGGLKGVLVDTGIGQVIADFVEGSAVPLTLLAWLVAVIVRVATGSATVSIVTTSGILAPSAAALGSTEIALLVLAIGAGSLFLSHVNDAGFWLVKEYMGVTVGQNFKTWSLLECIMSVTALIFVLVIGLFVG
ncbi:MAG: GntP family permease [Bifidobacteriaceae bacterium]|jgi:GntP family gluconate:H+ symporter|nr:GntP family permease [Bifidobacteriaceae bacterium]